jgi:outer membrane protease
MRQCIHDGILWANVLPAAACTGMILLCAAAAQALQATDGPEIKFDSEQFVSLSIRGSAGYLSGQTHDKIYFHPQYGITYTANELTWDMKDYMGGAMASIAFVDGFCVNAGYWRALGEGSGKINNYDWLRAGADWTDWSQSDANPSGSYVLDVNAVLDIWKSTSFAVGGSLGYKREFWSGSGRGGRYVYSSNPSMAVGTRDQAGTDSGATFVDYQQTIEIPYIGVNARMAMNNLAFSAYGLYGPWVNAAGKNRLLYPPAYFQETLSGGMFYGLGANAIYKLTEDWFLAFALDYQNISRLSGDAFIRGTAAEEEITDGAATSQHAVLYSLSAGYAF